MKNGEEREKKIKIRSADYNLKVSLYFDNES